MKSITIHNIDKETARLIELKAKESGLSLNKTIKILLQKAVGVSSEKQQKEEIFSEFLGVWDQQDFDEFQKRTNDLDKVDQNDWN